MNKLLSLPLLLALTLTGCALSPQSIELAPAPAITSENIGNNQSVAVFLKDVREDNAFGSRGGVYSDTSLIRAANELPEVFAERIRQGLQMKGFNAFSPQADSNRLEVDIKEFSYTPEAGSVVNRVTIQVVLHAIATQTNGSLMSNTYRASNEFDMPFTPTAGRNRTMLNTVAEAALEQLLEDRKLLDFLAQP